MQFECSFDIISGYGIPLINVNRSGPNTVQKFTSSNNGLCIPSNMGFCVLFRGSLKKRHITKTNGQTCGGSLFFKSFVRMITSHSVVISLKTTEQYF